jgi:hypothetical protein
MAWTCANAQGFAGPTPNRQLALSPRNRGSDVDVPVQLERRGTTSQNARRSPMFPPLRGAVQSGSSSGVRSVSRPACFIGQPSLSSHPFSQASPSLRLAFTTSFRSSPRRFRFARLPPSLPIQRDGAEQVTQPFQPRQHVKARRRSPSRRTARQARSRLRSPSPRWSQRWLAKRQWIDWLPPVDWLN